MAEKIFKSKLFAEGVKGEIRGKGGDSSSDADGRIQNDDWLNGSGFVF